MGKNDKSASGHPRRKSLGMIPGVTLWLPSPIHPIVEVRFKQPTHSKKEPTPLFNPCPDKNAPPGPPTNGLNGNPSHFKRNLKEKSRKFSPYCPNRNPTPRAQKNATFSSRSNSTHHKNARKSRCPLFSSTRTEHIGVFSDRRNFSFFCGPSNTHVNLVVHESHCERKTTTWGIWTYRLCRESTCGMQNQLSRKMKSKDPMWYLNIWYNIWYVNLMWKTKCATNFSHLFNSMKVLSIFVAEPKLLRMENQIIISNQKQLLDATELNPRCLKPFYNMINRDRSIWRGGDVARVK